MAAPMKELKVLELYSGIGGMHFALKESGLPYQVVTAIDVNTNANKVYKHNFPDTNVSDSAIEALTVKKFDVLNIDMILMSPPCQPFTRVGKQQDNSDPRTKSFLHVLELLKQAKSSPMYILVENVRGFEVSESRNRLLETLKQCHYQYQEFLMSPLQFGIPNSRLRYFLIAKKSPLKFAFEMTEEVQKEVPSIATKWLHRKHLAEKEFMHKSESGKCFCCGYSRKNSLNKHQSMSENSGNNSKRVTTSEDGEELHGDLKRQKLAETLDKDARESENNEANVKPVSEVEVVSSSSGNLSEKPGSEIDPTMISDNVSSASVGSGNVQSTVSRKEDRMTLDNVSSEGTDRGILSENTGVKHDCLQNYGHNMKQHGDQDPTYDCLENYGHNMRQHGDQDPTSHKPCLKLHHFLEETCADNGKFKDYLLKEKDLKRFLIMDIVNPCSRKSNCFTKRYGHYIEGAGSVVQITQDIQVVQKASDLKDLTVAAQNRDQWGETEIGTIRDLKLRYFTPREIANILCFPQDFDFPQDLTIRQKYMLLGNSLNVSIVMVLLRMLTTGDFDLHL